MRTSLNSKIGEYILLKFLSQIPEEEASKVSALSDGSKILNQLQSLIPNLEQKILEELNNFKKEYQET